MQRTLAPTLDIFTTGIVNVPKSDTGARYTFFEIDTKKLETVHQVLDVFDYYLHAVYVHETLNGFHFYNLTPIDKQLYWRIINEIKFLNPLCPLTTLRILPNKWQGEERFWKIGAIRGYTPELARFKEWIENGNNHMVAMHYQTVRYPFEECPKCKSSKFIVMQNGIFVCKNCNVQALGRLKKRNE